MRHLITGFAAVGLASFLCLSLQAADKKARTLTGPQGTVWAVAISPDGKLVAGASDLSEKQVKNGMEITNIKGSEVRIWEAETGKVTQTIPVSQQQTMAVAFSGDGKLLATGGFKEVKIWDVKTGEAKQTLKDHLGPVNALAFSPDGKVLATLSSWFNKGELRLYDTETWKLMRTLKEDKADLHCLSLSSDGKTIAAGTKSTQGGFKSDMKIWDLQTGEIKRILSETQGWVESVALSPDGKTMAAPSQFTIKLWDVQSGKTKRTMNEFVSALMYLPDGQTLAGRLNNEVKLFDAKSGKVKRTLKTGDNTWSWAFSKDGKMLAIGTGEAGKGAVDLWELSSGKK
jgi:WD40 repeat protein